MATTEAKLSYACRVVGASLCTSSPGLCIQLHVQLWNGKDQMAAADAKAAGRSYMTGSGAPATPDPFELEPVQAILATALGQNASLP